MGLRIYTINYIHDMINRAGFKLSGLRMCELGNQLIKDNYKGFSVAKEYFESVGIDHVSIDINGKNGALPLDLNNHLPAYIINKFDVVTNIGTSEHVKNNSMCFQNIHDLCVDGGIMIHLLPAVGVKHGIRQYSCDWFRDLSKHRNYSILYLVKKINNTTNYIWCTLRK